MLLSLALLIPLSTPSVAQGPIQETSVADGFHAEFIPADASFVAFLDLPRLRESALGLLWNSPAMEEQRGEVEAELGFDPMNVCSSLTLYDRGEDEEEVVVLVAERTPVDAFLGKLDEQGKLKTSQFHGSELLRSEENFICIEPRGDRVIVLVAEDPEEVLEGLKLVRGEGSSLAQDEAATGLRPGIDSFFFLCARELSPAMREFRPTSRVLGLAQAFRLDMGQKDDDLVSRVEVMTEDEHAARNAADVLRGALALARLAGGEDIPEKAYELLDALSIRTEGARLLLDLDYPIEQLLALVGSLTDSDTD